MIPEIDLAPRAAAARKRARQREPDEPRRHSHGAPSSGRLSWELWQRTRHMSLAEVCREEYIVSVACTSKADFAEGVRALLIDKDRKPRWCHADIGEISADEIADHFRPRFNGAHPLADLGWTTLAHRQSRIRFKYCHCHRLSIATNI